MERRDIYERLDQLPVARWDGPAFRETSVQYAGRVLSGEGARRAGGRWNPPESFRTVYASLEVETVVAEFCARVGPSRDAVEVAADRVMWPLKTRVDNLVDLRPAEHRRLVGLPDPFALTTPRQVSQEIGSAAFYVGYKGLLVPSAADPNATNLIVFPDHLGDDDLCELVSGQRPLASFLAS